MSSDAEEWHELTPAEWEEIKALPCDMQVNDIYDFAWCARHDTTFALGDVCRYHRETAP